ncbi:glycosyltransferase family 4 protein [Pantoea agglomerans]
MKKLCFYINSDWYFSLHWRERAIAAASSGYEVHVICNFSGDKERKLLESFGLITHDSNMSEQSLNFFVLLKDVYRSYKILKKIDPDIIHCITIKPCIIGGFFSKLNNKNLVLSFVGLGRVFSSGNIKFKVLKKIVTQLYKWVAKKQDVFFIFEHEKDRCEIISETGININKTVVINGAGVNLSDFKYIEEDERDIPVVLFASRLIWSKGLKDLVEAKIQLQKQGVEFILDVAGISVKNDPDSIPDTLIEEWSSKGVIRWLGKSDNVSELIKNSNIIALPSVYAEGVPRILIEAAAIGRATIAYDSGGCGSIIEDNTTGYLIQKNNFPDLIAKLNVLLVDDKLRRSFGKNASIKAVEDFSSQKVIATTLKIYKDLISRVTLQN